MIYVFEKVYECSRSAEVEADSFEDAKQMIADGEAEWYDNEQYLIRSKCTEYDDEADDCGEELEWKAEY